MAAVEILVKHPELKHGTVKIGFTPDEEVGHGADLFNVKKFGADFAYTVDGGELGELEFETFNAAQVIITLHGRSVHPGSAKNKMINSLHLAQEFDALLPVSERPEYTTGYEGFYHLMRTNGNIEETELAYIIRDHSRQIFEKRKVLMQSAVDFLNARYGKGTVELATKDQYYNMREKLEPVFQIVELAKHAIEALNIEPIILPVRVEPMVHASHLWGCPARICSPVECLPTGAMNVSPPTLWKKPLK